LEALFNSKNPDVNDLRKNGIFLIKKHRNSKYYIPTQEDIRWYNKDWKDDGLVDVKTADEYVKANIEDLNKRYPFLVTEWFCEWYDIMPDHHLLCPGELITKGDWILFFTLVNPLPGNIAISFCRLVKRLDVKQLVFIKREIVEAVWNDRDQRRKILTGDGIKAIYTYYMPYQEIRGRILTRAKEEERLVQKEKKQLWNTPSRYERSLRQIYNENKEFIETELAKGRPIEEITKEIIDERVKV